MYDEYTDAPELNAPNAFSEEIIQEAEDHYQRCDHCDAIVHHVRVDGRWQCVNQHESDLRQFI